MNEEEDKRPDLTVAPENGSSRYSLTVDAASDAFVQAGIPRSRRTVIRYCAQDHLDCIKVDTENSERYLINPDSIRRRIEEIRQAYPASRISPDAALGRDVTRRVETGPDASRHGSTAGVSEAPAKNEDLEKRVEELETENLDLKITNRGKDSFIKMIREQSTGLIQQVGDYRQRIGELETRLRLEAPRTQVLSDREPEESNSHDIHSGESEEAIAGDTKKADGHLEAPCPLHGGQDARHFRLSRSGRAFKCFGCGRGGNVFDLVAELEDAEIREAASLLIDWFKLSRTAATRRPPRTVAPAETRSARSTSATDV